SVAFHTRPDTSIAALSLHDALPISARGELPIRGGGARQPERAAESTGPGPRGTTPRSPGRRRAAGRTDPLAAVTGQPEKRRGHAGRPSLQPPRIRHLHHLIHVQRVFPHAPDPVVLEDHRPEPGREPDSAQVLAFRAQYVPGVPEP